MRRISPDLGGWLAIPAFFNDEEYFHVYFISAEDPSPP
jgi:hypothetical protein